MNRLYKIFLFLIVLIFLTTYNPNKLENIFKNNYTFFKILNIEILGNSLVKREEIEKKLNKLINKNILLVGRKNIEEPLKGIDFLEKIEVKKKYPNTIIIKVFETQALAILFKDKVKFILDSSSNLISFNKEIKYGEIPQIFGENAEKNFVHFYKKLEKNNFPIKEIKNYYYFQIGRWDLKLKNSKIIKLPESSADEAIRKSIKLLNRDDFKNYNIIDLRVSGKVIVE